MNGDFYRLKLDMFFLDMIFCWLRFCVYFFYFLLFHPIKARDNRQLLFGCSMARDTHPSCLIERVVKLSLHSDLSVRVGVDKRQPQVGVISAPSGQDKAVQKTDQKRKH